ncbi:hypothetical protein HNY73_002454 [Argiope bruennichi]|uniref:Uncharacterized protein n=1 Tax=Argiope bruennichi TaxID=94029 RepID=A0A8T0FTJ7_ARGBR|nr:hypothetical protein HNY73_002454 [Argiope bruennichi]
MPLLHSEEVRRPHLSNTLHQPRNNANYINAGPTSNKPSNKTATMGPVPPDHPSTPPPSYGIANDQVPMATQRLTKTGQFSLVASCCGENMTRGAKLYRSSPSSVLLYYSWNGSAPQIENQCFMQITVTMVSQPCLFHNSVAQDLRSIFVTQTQSFRISVLQFGHRFEKLERKRRGRGCSSLTLSQPIKESECVPQGRGVWSNKSLLFRNMASDTISKA